MQMQAIAYVNIVYIVYILYIIKSFLRVNLKCHSTIIYYTMPCKTVLLLCNVHVYAASAFMKECFISPATIKVLVKLL